METEVKVNGAMSKNGNGIHTTPIVELTAEQERRLDVLEVTAKNRAEGVSNRGYYDNERLKYTTVQSWYQSALKGTLPVDASRHPHLAAEIINKRGEIPEPRQTAQNARAAKKRRKRSPPKKTATPRKPRNSEIPSMQLAPAIEAALQNLITERDDLMVERDMLRETLVRVATLLQECGIALYDA